MTGALINGRGVGTSLFEVAFTGAGLLQVFDLRFVDAKFGSLLASIPVTIGGSAPVAERLLDLVIRRHGITFQVSPSGRTTEDDCQVEVLEPLLCSFASFGSKWFRATRFCPPAPAYDSAIESLVINQPFGSR